MANEFVARKGLIISGSTTSFKIEDLPGSGTSNEVLVRESDGTIKTKTNASSSGSSGTSGNDGSPGSSGSSGTSGANGAPGSSGSSGTSGNDGSPGSSGSSGTSGANGSSGSSGSSGTSGANGAPGSSGSSGTSGNDGSPGSSGTSGADGSLTLTGTTDNGVITLNGTAPNATVESNLIFDGSKLLVSGSGSTIFEVIGSEGQLFSITDSLSGSLFAVSDVSGFPILEVFSDDKIVGGTFNSNTFVVTGSQIGIGHDSPSTLLHISGSAPLRIEGLAAGSESLFLTVDSNGVVKTNTAGAAGSSGSSGSSGTSGNDGSPGSSGSSGTSGANGAPGSSGSSGTSGNDGSNGAPGSSGSSGTSGNDGSNGAPGSSGSSGTSGNDGSNGAPGSSGSSGTSGILPLTGTTTNGIITYDGDGTGTVESNLTFNGSTLSAPKLSLNSNNPLIVQTQAGDAITVNDDLGGNIVKLGDVDLSGNEVYVSIDDPDSQILLNTPLLNLKNNTPTIISGSSSAKFKLDTYAFGYNTFPGVGFDVTGSGIIVSSSLPSTHYPMVKIGETELIDLTTDTALSGHTFNIHNVDDFRVTSGSEPTELNTNVLFEHTGLGFNVYTKGQTTATMAISSASVQFSSPEIRIVPNNDLWVGSKNNTSTPQYVATWDVAPTNSATGAVLKYTTASVFAGGGGGSSTLAGLSDVTLSGLADGDLLRYNGTATEWQNTNLGLSLTPEVSAIEGGYFGGYAKITNWGSYTQPSAQASVVSGSAETLIDTCDISSNGEITWDDSNTTTGERILKVQVQDFGDLASEITTGSYTKSSASYRYFRWYAVSASSNAQIDEFRFYTSENQGGTKYPPNMTSNTAPSPYVAASSGNYSGYFPYEAFDSSTFTEWWNLASPPYQGAYLSIDFGTSQTIKSMRITHGGTYQSFTVANIQGSSDNTNWDTIHTYVNDPNNPNTSARNFG